MRKSVFLLAVIAGLALAAMGLAVAEEPTPTPSYVLYLPLVIGGSGDRVVLPDDYCTVSYLENAATGNGLLSYCRSANPQFMASVSLATGYAPSPGGGQSRFLERSYYFFGAVPASPVLNLRINHASWDNTRQAILEVYSFPVPWTMPFTITESMLAYRGEKLGETVVISQSAPFTITIPLSGFRPGQGIVVLSPCESQPDRCIEPGSIAYVWEMLSFGVGDVWVSESYPWP